MTDSISHIHQPNGLDPDGLEPEHLHILLEYVPESWNIALRWQYGDFGGFFTALMDAIVRADGPNMERLERGFPEHVRAVRDWRNGIIPAGISEIPYTKDDLRSECQKRFRGAMSPR